MASRRAEASHENLKVALDALSCVEHRGACAADQRSSDGAGIMADIPFDLLGYAPGEVAVATLFVTADPDPRYQALSAFQNTFSFLGLEVLDYREVPVNHDVLGPVALQSAPQILQAIIKRPPACRTDASFNARLYAAKQLTRTKLLASDSYYALYFVSLSTTTIVYKALTRSEDLGRFFPDLQNPAFVTRFALFHRRFSTNTRTSWDKAQPFRLIAHNGEINTIAGNRSSSYAREQDLGLNPDELLTHENISDSGNLNEMVEALKYRSSIPHLEDILAIMMPPAGAFQRKGYYAFWGRAMEPWDGPAFITYCDGATIGARLDRNGFRPCRWAMTRDTFYLASEAGIFGLEPQDILAKGTLRAGSGVTLELQTGELHLDDPSQSRENRSATFEPRLVPFEITVGPPPPGPVEQRHVFGLTQDELERVLVPMIAEGKEPIGSMGDTARLAIFSEQRRSFFDFFFQNFAQVTNPPLDYLRERMVTDLSCVLGRRPNIFAPTELIPPTPALALDSPILTPAGVATLRGLNLQRPDNLQKLRTYEIDCLFERRHGPEGLERGLEQVAQAAIDAVEVGARILILSQRRASVDNPPIPSLLAVRAVVSALNRTGTRLDASVVLDVGDAVTTHHVACLIGFGATAVCPFLAMEIARYEPHKDLRGLTSEEKEANLQKALEQGLLKIMSKMGISVVRSYHSSKLFTALGLGEDIMSRYFVGVPCLIGGLSLVKLGERILRDTEASGAGEALPQTYLFKEHNKGDRGERHAMTAARSKIVHRWVRSENGEGTQWEDYERQGREAEPISVSHLLDFVPTASIPTYMVQPAEEITARFVSGAMSFGAISAESQRDIILAMRTLGGQSNSGEGGENPYYYVDGTTASIKQVASARFGVTAEYLVSSPQFEIKIAQGAKPGEGGQLMGVKVTEDIARARHAHPGVDLISPPPQHDIYSIEDLKQLIYELKQLSPTAKVGVKLVSGANIGTIAAGVVKAGADVIQISGGSGGTGAAPLTSMKHAGLPWELGLAQAHQVLVEQDLREQVVLRVDGGLHTARDIVVAALLGAEEFGFGKLLLVAQGCIMARICEKNRCPTGIATHDPKFKAKYKGEAQHVVQVLRQLAEGVREILARLGAARLTDVMGQRELLQIAPSRREWVKSLGLDLRLLLEGPAFSFEATPRAKPSVFFEGVSPLNQRLLEDAAPALTQGTPVELSYDIRSTDRAVLTRLSGALAHKSHQARMAALRENAASGRPVVPDYASYTLPEGTIRVRFRGSAGQGFGAFAVGGLDVELWGEANDSVAKSMSGGTLVIVPDPASTFVPEKNVIIGNCALYGATGGKVFIRGLAGDRFCVRNSGATAVVEGAGLHACEYMTGGVTIILGEVSYNVGAGMTGGTLYLRRDQHDRVNHEYLLGQPLDRADGQELAQILTEYHERTGSASAAKLLQNWRDAVGQFTKYRPRSMAAFEHAQAASTNREPSSAAG